MEKTGTLKNARRISSGDPRAPCLSGDIYGDVRGRFRDGERIRTSTIIWEDGNTFTTRNSVYQVESWKSEKDNLKTEHGNRYDWRDIVRRESVVIAGPMKLAAYKVRDPDTGELSGTQFHLTYDNMVMAVMGEEAAKLFVGFVSRTLAEVA